MKARLIVTAGVGFLSLYWTVASEASPLNPYELTTKVTNGNATQSTNYTVNPSQGAPITNTLITGGLSATASATISPSPSETVKASSGAGDGISSANVDLQYFFEVVAVTGSATSLNVNIAASGGVTQTLVTAGNSAELTLTGFSGSQLLASACTFPAGLGSCAAEGLANQTSFSINDSELLTVGVEYSLAMDLFVASYGGSGTKDSQSGYIDPVISFANSADVGPYELIFSAGVGDSPATTPLPAALPLFATGLGGLGLFGWRRKRKNTAAVAA
jgi:hypothetical protein